ncbi:MAG: hypothetical protein K6A37_04315 [Saccharofermentans sp.]|nr:hypothetical protein [Saccharofermentans sp.]
MITDSIEERFHIIDNLITEYAVSLPYLSGNEERFFSYEWKTMEDGKHLVVHDLYIRNRESCEVTIKEINNDTKISDRLSDGVLGLEALEIEDQYMDNHEKALLDQNEDVKNALRNCFNKLITDKALLDTYIELGIEFL